MDQTKRAVNLISSATLAKGVPPPLQPLGPNTIENRSSHTAQIKKAITDNKLAKRIVTRPENDGIQIKKITRKTSKAENNTRASQLAQTYRTIIPKKSYALPTPRNIAELANLKSLKIPNALDKTSRYESLMKNHQVFWYL